MDSRALTIDKSEGENIDVSPGSKIIAAFGEPELIISEIGGKIELICDSEKCVVIVMPAMAPVCVNAENNFFQSETLGISVVEENVPCVVKLSGKFGQPHFVKFSAKINRKKVGNPTGLIIMPEVFRGFICTEMYNGTWVVARAFDSAYYNWNVLSEDKDKFLLKTCSTDLTRIPVKTVKPFRR